MFTHDLSISLVMLTLTNRKLQVCKYLCSQMIFVKSAKTEIES